VLLLSCESTWTLPGTGTEQILVIATIGYRAFALAPADDHEAARAESKNVDGLRSKPCVPSRSGDQRGHQGNVQQ
jgi:hypothetical protein